MAKKQSVPERGINIKTAAAEAAGSLVELFGHVTLVEGYSLPNFNGCHALVALRDTPGKTVAVLTRAASHRPRTSHRSCPLLLSFSPVSS